MSPIYLALKEGNKAEHEGAAFDLHITTIDGREYTGAVGETECHGMYFMDVYLKDEDKDPTTHYINERHVVTARVVWA